MNLYEFIDTQKAEFPLSALCRATDVPESSYFDWNHHGRRVKAGRQARADDLVAAIREVHEDSGATYGSPRVHAQLRRDGQVVALRTVEELMGKAGIVGISGREHTTTTTRRDRLTAPFPDLLGRRFLPSLPNLVWYGDITYIWVKDRFWYLATVIDAATKELVGWSFADHMRTDLISEALHKAVRRRGGKIGDGLIFHPDYAEVRVKPRDRVLACVGGVR